MNFENSFVFIDINWGCLKSLNYLIGITNIDNLVIFVKNKTLKIGYYSRVFFCQIFYICQKELESFPIFKVLF